MEGIKGKYQRLEQILSVLPNVLVAYSGGVDSTFLLKVATNVLGTKAMGIIGVSPSLPQRELKEALQVALEQGLRVDTIQTHELDNHDYQCNPVNRCYFCKKELFIEIYSYARVHKYQFIADGTNADDLKDHRPGLQAARELKVLSPLKDARLTKAEIRYLSRQLGLPTWNKPEMACLSSRFPTGTAITVETLKQVEAAEDFLWELGFRQLRVRHHGYMARIELAIEEMPRILHPEIRLRVESYFKTLGYTSVTLDLSGYRRGNADRETPVTTNELDAK